MAGYESLESRNNFEGVSGGGGWRQEAANAWGPEAQGFKFGNLGQTADLTDFQLINQDGSSPSERSALAAPVSSVATGSAANFESSGAAPNISEALRANDFQSALGDYSSTLTGIGANYNAESLATTGAGTNVNADMGGQNFGISGNSWDDSATPNWQSELTSAAAGNGNMQTALNDLGAAYPNDAETAAKAANQVLVQNGQLDSTLVTGDSTGNLTVTSGLDSTKTTTNVGADYAAPSPPAADNTSAPSTDNAPPVATGTPVNADMGGQNFGIIGDSWDDNATPNWQSELASAAAGNGNMQTALNDLGAAYPNDAETAAKAANQVLAQNGEQDLTLVTGDSTGNLTVTSGLDSTKTTTNVGADYAAPSPPTADNISAPPTDAAPPAATDTPPDTSSLLADNSNIDSSSWAQDGGDSFGFGGGSGGDMMLLDA